MGTDKVRAAIAAVAIEEVTCGSLSDLAPNWPAAPTGNVKGQLYWTGRDIKNWTPRLMTWDGETKGGMRFVRYYPSPCNCDPTADCGH